uniref:GPS domain-containing protein n=1 Tax=Macrostomum lignano TaxID=282301 RepID=A0A1I8JRB5_9PLAT
DLTITITSERPDTEIELIPDEAEMSGINIQTFVDQQQEWRLHEHIEVEKRTLTQEFSSTMKSHPCLAVRCRAARRPGYFYWNVFLIMVSLCESGPEFGSIRFIGWAVRFIGIRQYRNIGARPARPSRRLLAARISVLHHRPVIRNIRRGSGQAGGRLQLSFTLFLTSVAFKFVINQSLPKISYLTYMVSTANCHPPPHHQFMISGLSFATFAVEPHKCEYRLRLSFTLVLTSVTFKYVVAQSLPRISYLTYMAWPGGAAAALPHGLLGGAVLIAFLLLLLLLPLVKEKRQEAQGGCSSGGPVAWPGDPKEPAAGQWTASGSNQAACDKYVLMSLAILCIVSIWHAVVTMIQPPNLGGSAGRVNQTTRGRDGELGADSWPVDARAESGEPCSPPPAPHGDGEQDRRRTSSSASACLYVWPHVIFIFWLYYDGVSKAAGDEEEGPGVTRCVATCGSRLRCRAAKPSAEWLNKKKEWHKKALEIANARRTSTVLHRCTRCPACRLAQPTASFNGRHNTGAEAENLKQNSGFNRTPTNSRDDSFLMKNRPTPCCRTRIQFYQMVESHGRGANRKNSVGADLARRQHHQHHHRRNHNQLTGGA